MEADSSYFEMPKIYGHIWPQMVHNSPAEVVGILVWNACSGFLRFNLPQTQGISS